MNLAEDWPEGFALIVLVIGFILSLLTINSILNYFVVFLGGAILGHMYYKQEKKMKHIPLIIGLGFLIGFTLGNFYGNLGKTLIIFGIGAYGSYYLHNKKYIDTR